MIKYTTTPEMGEKETEVIMCDVQLSRDIMNNLISFIQTQVLSIQTELCSGVKHTLFSKEKLGFRT